MEKNEMAEIELQMKEQRVAYWETHHSMPSREMADFIDDLPEMTEMRG